MLSIFLCWITILNIWVSNQGLSMGLRIIQLEKPGPPVHSGESTWLMCQYELEQDELYIVKWYKNNVEFFRYMPHFQPSGLKLELPGVYVDLENSNATHVHLYTTDLNTEGMYSCEVSTEYPFRQKVKANKKLNIYVLPTDGPVIKGIDPPYQIDEVVNISCTSGPSKPAAHMRWFINDKELQPTNENHFPPIRHPNGLQATRIGLDFKIDRNHFSSGKINIVCLSSIPQVYSNSSKELVIGVIGDSGVSLNYFDDLQSAQSQEGPFIEGSELFYNVGDMVTIRCFSARSPFPVHMNWFVNDMEAKSENLERFSTTRYSDGSETSILGLRMRLEPHLVKKYEVRLKCTTTLYIMMTMRAEKTLSTFNRKKSSFHTAENKC